MGAGIIRLLEDSGSNLRAPTALTTLRDREPSVSNVFLLGEGEAILVRSFCTEYSIVLRHPLPLRRWHVPFLLINS